MHSSWIISQRIESYRLRKTTYLQLEFQNIWSFLLLIHGHFELFTPLYRLSQKFKILKSLNQLGDGWCLRNAYDMDDQPTTLNHIIYGSCLRNDHLIANHVGFSKIIVLTMPSILLLDEQDSPQWYDIVHLEHKLSCLCFEITQKALYQWK